ncbi:efflux RND transporter periplasmic adaptor subunit [Phenylobacterium soli]|uniref:Efflux transporter periplasmic adaptor subunit n=1 Tax=Phenylobacterium soli TaxID=2170551 RepID=A0A328AMX9_9CAUL|nr:efflux RND transporter periplasmic adaptor subunit [Phenylobacterium soli]RAK55695.1 efflux transporter periplasmic adaptor subunit [Phenylobacterium soli]
MRLKSQYVFVIGVAALVVLYFVVRGLFGGGHTANPAQAKATPAANAAPAVQVKLVPESVREYDVVLRGRTQATRTVQVKSETAGLVAATPVLQGTVVRQGAVLCRLSVDARQATLDQAKANYKSAQLQQQAAAELSRKGYRSPTQVLAAQAALDSAQASVRQAEIALRQVEIRAPFTGVFDHRDAEVGTYLSPGQSCGVMIELNPLLIVGDVPETDAAKLHVGEPAVATLVDGQKLQGRIRYVARDADPATRTYHLEIIVPNGQLAVRSGLSADVRVAAGQGPAHLVPVSALVLDAAGRQGLRYVTADERVAFAPVTVLEQTPQGAWVKGLAGSTRIITVGQSYVAEGQKVRVAAAL